MLGIIARTMGESMRGLKKILLHYVVALAILVLIAYFSNKLDVNLFYRLLFYSAMITFISIIGKS